MRFNRSAAALLAVCMALTATSCSSQSSAESTAPDSTVTTTTAAQSSQDEPQSTEQAENSGGGQTVSQEAAVYSLSREGYELEQVVILSRHNIRSPLSTKDSVLGQATPHEWIGWSSAASELSLRGGVCETVMGQYFKKWLEKEGLFPENYRPEGQEVRFYSNSKQRTIATANYFKAGLLPASDLQTEYHMEFDKMDPVFTPQLTFTSPEYNSDVEAQVREMFSDKIKALESNYKLISDVIDLEQSAAYADGTLTGFSTDDLDLVLEENAEPGMKGSLKTGCSISDALVLQYYEQPDDKKAAFGHDLSFEDWKQISAVKDLYGDVLFTAPLVAPNVAHPLLKEMSKELGTAGRKFTFLCGHDSNVGSVLAALGAEEYTLPDAIEAKTPIGCKLVFCKWKNAAGEEFLSCDLVYQSVQQLRNISLLDLEHTPVVYSVSFAGLQQTGNGLYKAEDLMGRFESAIAEYDDIIGEYYKAAA